MSWERGRADIERLLKDGELALVPASSDLAERMFEDASRHLASSGTLVNSDPTGAYSLAYDAARKASAALLAVQGLRATTRGGHIAIQDAVRFQFNGEGGLPAFKAIRHMRRTRNDFEYPDIGTPDGDPDDADGAINDARAIVAATRQLLDSERLEPFVTTT